LLPTLYFGRPIVAWNGRFSPELAFTLMQQHGVTILRPPRDGYMAFVRSPDGVSIELLQANAPLPPAEPWASMPNVGQW